MMVFLFVAVLYMFQVQKAVGDYQDSRDALYQELNATFGDKFQEWEMELDHDLTIKFTNPEVLFDYQSAEITPYFAVILSEFIPQYLAILTKDEYKDTISEVRIEGHTADWDDYLYTIQLSQQRAYSVLAFALNSGAYASLPPEEQSEVKFWLTANGLGNGRAIDVDGNYVHESGKTVSSHSRRVEFRIVTRNEEIIKEVLNNTNFE